MNARLGTRAIPSGFAAWATQCLAAWARAA